MFSLRRRSSDFLGLFRSTNNGYLVERLPVRCVLVAFSGRLSSFGIMQGIGVVFHLNARNKENQLEALKLKLDGAKPDGVVFYGMLSRVPSCYMRTGIAEAAV